MVLDLDIVAEVDVATEVGIEVVGEGITGAEDRPKDEEGLEVDGIAFRLWSKNEKI